MNPNRPRLTALVVSCGLLLAACGSAPSWGTVTRAGQERQRVECRGTTAPAIVFVHGIGDKAGSASFERVLGDLPDGQRVCRYDRPGAGDSPEPTKKPRDAADLARELDSVVERADPRRPVVLVGHSFGSYPALTYTARHRARVAGLVLLDGVDPELGLRTALGASSWSDVGQADEHLDLPRVQEQTSAAVQDTRVFADLPLVVVVRDKGVTPSWRAAQERLAALSAKGTLVTAHDSGHEVPADDPGAVRDAIRRVSG